jgi:hypothetical protein
MPDRTPHRKRNPSVESVIMKNRFIAFGLITGLAATTAMAQSGGVGGAPRAGAATPGTPGGRIINQGVLIRPVNPAVLPPSIAPAQPGLLPGNQSLAPPVISGPNVGFAAGTNRVSTLTNQAQLSLQFRGTTNELRPGLQTRTLTNQFSLTNQFVATTNLRTAALTNQFLIGTNQFGIITNGFAPVITTVAVLVTAVNTNQFLFPTGPTSPTLPNVPNQPGLPPPSAGMTPPLPTTPGGP